MKSYFSTQLYQVSLHSALSVRVTYTAELLLKQSTKMWKYMVVE